MPLSKDVLGASDVPLEPFVSTVELPGGGLAFQLDRFVSTGDYLITVGGGQPGTAAAHADAHLQIQGEEKLPE